MAELLVTKKDTGTTRSLAVGARLSIHLAENPTTGFQWHLREELKPVLALVSDDYAQAPSGGVGGGGIRQYIFVAKQPGVAVVRLDYKRSWEDDTQTIDRFSLRVEVFANPPAPSAQKSV